MCYSANSNFSLRYHISFEQRLVKQKTTQYRIQLHTLNTSLCVQLAIAPKQASTATTNHYVHVDLNVTKHLSNKCDVIFILISTILPCRLDQLSIIAVQFNNNGWHITNKQPKIRFSKALGMERAVETGHLYYLPIFVRLYGNFPVKLAQFYDIAVALFMFRNWWPYHLY